MKKKVEIVLSKQVKKQLKTLPKKVRKEIVKKIEQLKVNPYLGEPVEPGEMKCILIEQFYNLEPSEVLSLVASNGEWFENNKEVSLLLPKFEK